MQTSAGLMAPPVYSQTLILSGEPSSDSSRFPVKRAGESPIHSSAFFFFFFLLSLSQENTFALQSFTNLLLLLLLLQLNAKMMYTCKCVKCMDALPEFKGWCRLIFSELRVLFFFSHIFFSLSVSLPRDRSTFLYARSAATPERLFQRRRAERRVKLEKLIAAERGDL